MSSKQNPPNDPHFEREASKYENPIPSREYILAHLKECGQLLSRNQLAEALDIRDEDTLEALRRRLKAMERDGQIHRNRRGAYGLVEKMGLIKGRIQTHRDGFGFVIPDDHSPDLYIPARDMRIVFDGDQVLAQITSIDERGRKMGAIVEVLARASQNVVGRFSLDQGVGFVVPQNPKLQQHTIVIPERHQQNATAGQIVMVSLLSPPTKRFHATGEIIEILGDELEPGMEIDVAIRQFNLPHRFEDQVMNEVEKLSPLISPHNRLDLRNKPFVTIDGEDAQDFDDAVYTELKPDGGFKLWVAIADVSHYVKPHAALDTEAQHRGNSVYFPSRVIPMLPERLSNDLCSLKPHVDRLVLVAECQLSAKGTLTHYQFSEGIIHSKARLTYTQVADYLDHPEKPVESAHQPLLPHLRDLKTLFDVLFAGRKERGAIEFESRETKIEFDELNRIKRIVPVQRNIAHRIIEECMLMANVAAAKWLLGHKSPALYRIHDTPPPDQIQELREHLARVKIRLPGGEKPEPGDFAKALEEVRSKPEASSLELLILRTMAQATYSPHAIGHFGLAYSAYTHFTSPIRRYPDLIVHRALKGELKLGDAPIPALEKLGEHCSHTERRADEATRDVTAWLKCEYMQHKVGESLPGVITGITGFGLFIQLNDFYVEGLVHISSLSNDYYHFEPSALTLTGERSGVVYRIGMPVQVTVANVDLDQRHIDFVLEPKGGFASNEQKKSHSKSSKKKRPTEGKSGASKGAPSSKRKRKPKPKSK